MWQTALNPSKHTEPDQPISSVPKAMMRTLGCHARRAASARVMNSWMQLTGAGQS